MTFQDQLDRALSIAFDRVENEMPEYGEFIPIIELFDNLDGSSRRNVGKYGIRIFKMPEDVVADPKKRYIEAVAYEPSGSYKISAVAGSGDKAEIKGLLESHDFAVSLNRIFGELLYSLEYY